MKGVMEHCDDGDDDGDYDDDERDDFIQSRP